MKVSKGQLRTAVKPVADDLIERGPLTVSPVVGLKEINRMFGTADNTAYQWRSRKVLPKEDGEVSNNPVWKLPTIYAWAEETGREIVWDPWGIQQPDGSGERSS